MDESFVDQHWQKIGERALDDFRAASVSKKALQLLGKRPGTILDIGAGAGTFVILAHSLGYPVLGIDTSEAQVRSAHQLLTAKGLPERLIRRCLLEDLTAEGVYFDSAVMLDVIEHIPEPVQFLNTVRLVLKPQARIIVSVPAIPHFYGERDRLSGHYLRYDPQTLCTHLVEGGYEVEQWQYWNFLGWLKRVWGQKVNPHKVEYYEFRYSTSWRARTLNSLLSLYFASFENKVRLPIGLSLLATARCK